MVRNGDIRGFFGAKPSPSSASSSSRPATATATATGRSSSATAAAAIADCRQQEEEQPLPSSPRTPPPAAKRHFGLQDEVKGSDDEDGESDDSLASLSAILGRKAGPASYQRPSNTASTPQAKRVASMGGGGGGGGGGGLRHGSPLTLQQKQKHKFDLKALISHSRQNEREEEISRQAEDLINKAEDSISSSSDGDGDGDDEDDEDGLGSVDGARTKKKKKKEKNLQQVAKDLLLDRNSNGNDGEDDENPKGDKIARAIVRTQVQGKRRRCYFFDLDLPPLFKPARAPFPADAARGPWRFLADPHARDQAVVNGLPHTAVAARGRELPDELFCWVLDQVCVERDPRLRAQYCGLVVACREATSRLVRGERLYGALERVGGPRYAAERAKLKATPEVEEPYRGRDWSGLAAFLDLLQKMAPNLDYAAVLDAVQLLLRMSLDPVISTAVRREHLAALEALVTALPGSKWNMACGAICDYVLKSTAADDDDDDEVIIQRLIPVASIPKSTAKLADLRRRLAAAVLFNDAVLGTQDPDSSLDAALLLERLARPDFSIRPDTDFEGLRALVALVDIAVESGGFLRRPGHDVGDNGSSDVEEGKGGGGGGTEARDKGRNRGRDRDRDRQFDADIDALTFRLRALHDKIHDNGLLARKEAKAAIDVVSKRLTYAVRTRPPAKTSIFDLHQQQQPSKEDADLPRQRDFMKSWAQRRAETAAERKSPAVL